MITTSTSQPPTSTNALLAELPPREATRTAAANQNPAHATNTPP